MGWKSVLGSFLLFVLIFGTLGMVFVYFFFPLNPIDFVSDTPLNSNFSLNSSIPAEMQFYHNMRYTNSQISYKIDESCNLKRKDDMTRAFEMLQEKTILRFYPVSSDEEISINCSDEVIVNKQYFIAGEGGPTEIIRTPNFDVILKGKILLLSDSKCEKPNVALHELLHALGFDHSKNRYNILYNISDCKQILGEDIPATINALYSIPPKADLAFNDVKANMHSRYLDINTTIQNQGLKDAPASRITIYADNKKVKEQSLEEIKVGYEITMLFQNILISQLNVQEITVEIEASFDEIEKSNNKIKLKIKE